MADLYDGWWTTNRQGYLNQAHKNDNARLIGQYFTKLGWTRESICALLGNIEIETRMDPLNQSGDIVTGAYGLVQWHPPTKLINFAESRGLDYKSGWTQLERIKYQWQNNIQWQFTGISFDEFTKSDEAPEKLAKDWAYHYEVSAQGTWDQRAQWARYYYDNLRFKKIPIWLLTGEKWRRRWKW